MEIVEVLEDRIALAGSLFSSADKTELFISTLSATASIRTWQS